MWIRGTRLTIIRIHLCQRDWKPLALDWTKHSSPRKTWTVNDSAYQVQLTGSCLSSSHATYSRVC